MSELRLEDRNTKKYSLAIAHNKQEETFLSVKPTSSKAKKGGIAFQESPEVRHFLLFGFDVPDKRGPREVFQETLEQNLDFATAQNIKVVFIWKLPSFTPPAATSFSSSSSSSSSPGSTTTTLEDLHHYVDQKSYYQLQFRKALLNKSTTRLRVEGLKG